MNNLDFIKSFNKEQMFRFLNLITPECMYHNRYCSNFEYDCRKCINSWLDKKVDETEWEIYKEIYDEQ